MLAYRSHRSGFSLVEMSIVIVVIGLILAAVMKGQTVIDAARVRALISEVNTYKTAVNSFYAKYNALPGDFTEARIYWTASNTQNGNGDGRLSFKNGAGIYEGYQAWQHLSNENMVATPFLGTQTTAVAELDKDIPKARTGGGYFFDYGSIAQLLTDNILVLGTPLASRDRLVVDGTVSAKQAYEMDIKTDDASPVSGAIQAQEGSTGKPETCVDPKHNRYAIAVEGKNCVVGFKLITQ